MRLALAFALCVVAGGCFTGGDRDEGDCVRDADCDGECTRTNECVEAGTSIRVEVAWTIAGAPASDDSCAPFAELEILFYQDEVEVTNYVPIPCRIGRSTYDKMPPRLDRVELVAYDESGRTVDSQSAALEPTGTTTVAFDLQP